MDDTNKSNSNLNEFNNLADTAELMTEIADREEQRLKEIKSLLSEVSSPKK